MSIDKRKKFDEDDTIFAQRQRDEELWEQISDDAVEAYSNWTVSRDGTSGKIATNPKDYVTRACVRCNGKLQVFEETEEGFILLQCRSCGKKQWHTDIAPYPIEEQIEKMEDAREVGVAPRNLPDELYRKIPTSLVHEYTEMRKKMKRK